MIIDSLHAENILTLGTFELRLDGKSCVVVGPNGSGKSTIVRVLDLVQKALDSVGAGMRGQPFAEAARQVLQSYAAAKHYGESLERPTIVRLGVQFTTAEERMWLLTYFRAAVLHTMLQELSGVDISAHTTVGQWVGDEITEERIAPLFAGTIVLQHAGLPHTPWEVSYEFEHGESRYSWFFSNNAPNVIVRTFESTGPLRRGPQRRLAEHLLGMQWSGSAPASLPSPLPQFEFGNLCARPASNVAAPTLLVGAGSFDSSLAPFRAAIGAIGIPPLPQSQQVFSLGYVLSALLNEGIIVLGEQLRGLGTGGTPPQQPGPYSWDALVSPVRSHAPSQLPLRLFELKNGNTDQRQRFAAIQDEFRKLAPGRTIDVTFQATAMGGLTSAPLSAGQVALLGTSATEQPQPGAAITIVVDRVANTNVHPNSLPIQLHGAGTWEALVLAEALAEAPNRFVVLDEPAVTLHPTWQRALRLRVKAADGQLLLITHSEDLVSMEDGDDLQRLVRLENETGQTQVHRFMSGELEASEVSRITRDFAFSVDAVSLLFARGVVLVEGETELGALPKWFAECAAQHGLPKPSELDLAFWSVGGDTHFRTYVTVLQQLAIPWTLICDGAAFNIEKRQKHLPHIFDQVLSAQVDAPSLGVFLNGLPNPEARAMSPHLFATQRALGREHGIFTLAIGWKTRDKDTGAPNNESFEVFVESVAPGQLARAREAVGESKVRQGRWLADNVGCPQKVSELYVELVKVLEQRGLHR